jgi:hypothetical protein
LFYHFIPFFFLHFLPFLYFVFLCSKHALNTSTPQGFMELTQLKGNQMSCNKLKYPGNNTSPMLSELHLNNTSPMLSDHPSSALLISLEPTDISEEQFHTGCNV